MDVLAHMSDICDFIDKRLGNPGPSSNPIVHSSRTTRRRSLFSSPVVVIAYLMRKHEVKGKRKIRPSENFLDQLRAWEAVEYQVWADEDRKIPKEPYQAYLDRRAVRLKAKGLTGDEAIGITRL